VFYSTVTLILYSFITSSTPFVRHCMA